MANRSLALAVVALGLLGCLTGCTRAVAGLAIPGSTPVSAAMSASRELGDFTTIEPCGMVDVPGLPVDMQAELEPSDTFDSCALRVDSAGAAIELEVGALVYDDDDTGEIGPVALPSGLALYTGSVQEQSCTAYLKFAEGIEMTSVAYANDGDGTANLCTTAAAVARNVSGVLAKGPVQHRGFPKNSFATIDPCPLLTDDTLAPLGFDSEDQTSYPAHHECEWTGSDQGDDVLSAYVSFIVGPPPAAQADVSTAAQIAGRSSVLVSTTDDSAAECWIDTAGQTFGAQQGLVEIAEVYISDADQSTDTACQLGTSLATAVWPKLPPAP